MPKRGSQKSPRTGLRANTGTPNFQGFSIPNTTPIPDELFDQLLPDLTGSELKVLLYIFRRTLGFKKREDAVALPQIVNGIVHQGPDGTEVRLDRGAGVSRRAAIQAIQGLEAKGIVEVYRNRTPEGDNEVNVYRPRFRDEGGGAKNALPKCKICTTGGAKNAPTIATAAGGGGEAEIFQFFAQLAEIERKPTSAELEIIRQLLADDGIPQDAIQAGIKQAFQTRRYADGIPTLAQCARVVRRLHHRKHRENDARTTDCPAAAGESTTREVAASGLATHAVQPAADQAVDNADPLADVWAVLREGSCSKRDYDTAANRLGLRHLLGEPEQIYQAVIEAIAYGAPPDRLVGYVRSIVERWAAEAQAQQQVGPGSPLPARERHVARATHGDSESPLLAGDQPFDSAQDNLWETALTELRLQMTKATFDTWLTGSRLVSADDGTCIIAVCSEYARDWLEAQLKPVVARTLTAVLGREVEVQFVVTKRPIRDVSPLSESSNQRSGP